ncbi:amine oxidase [Aspergillus eucalypticola CBS 122712]|uniref:Amine oxidase n=1 Tax=Aspergillus eucalypticola (strain CBS 122712 / IBT 29274) TaxID=1448314 RepID=A0A317UY76_ASPEC|nr:amine oxidase [Aspergillus eucalypticola CBS 122712]PWY65487.1 amine oxidase [Aspergillus eucalypticola CBS 122712]
MYVFVYPITKLYDVVIVGAGLSGLQAAHYIQAAGFSVCILEVTDRVVGKTLTVKSSKKGYNDLGAAWVNDTNQSGIFKLHQRYGLDGVVQYTRGDDILESGEGVIRKIPYGWPLTGLARKLMIILRDESSRMDLDDPKGFPEAKEVDNMTLDEFCVDRSGSQNAVHMADAISSGLLGVDSVEVSALYMLYYFNSGRGIDNLLSDEKDGAHYLRTRQGTQTIARKMADELDKSDIFLGVPVTSISQSHDDSPCVVQTLDGISFSCRRVIVSIPTNLYQSISSYPPLPQAKRVLSNHTIMGNNTWSELSKGDRFNQAWEQFCRCFGKFVKDIPKPYNTLEMEWSKEPYFFGAPCPAMTPGLLTTVGTDLAAPHGKVHFIGTETSTVWRGYMEGAIRAGQRGAAEVATALQED